MAWDVVPEQSRLLKLRRKPAIINLPRKPAVKNMYVRACACVFTRAAMCRPPVGRNGGPGGGGGAAKERAGPALGQTEAWAERRSMGCSVGIPHCLSSSFDQSRPLPRAPTRSLPTHSHISGGRGAPFRPAAFSHPNPSSAHLPRRALLRCGTTTLKLTAYAPCFRNSHIRNVSRAEDTKMRSSPFNDPLRPEYTRLHVETTTEPTAEQAG